MDIEKIPQELRERNQWLMWYYQDGTKIPIGESNDPKSWRPFAELRGTRIAFVIDADDPYTGIDLDDCVSDGVINEQAMGILLRFKGVAYAEISPSGTGIKLTTRGAKPIGSRCSVGGWLECYDHARFWTVTGNVLEGFETIGDGQASVDWLCNTYLAQAPPKSQAPIRAVSSSVEQRAQAYVDAAELPQPGSRNNAAFRLAGHLAAIVGSDGERLTQGDVQEFVSIWNSRLLEPLSEKEVQTVTSSALKNGTPRQDKEPELASKDYGVDHSQFMQEFQPDESEPEVGRLPDDPGHFPADCLLPPGFIGEVARFTLDTSDEPQPILALGGAMCLLSVLTGRKIRNERDNRTNIFVLGLGPSGCGKDRPRKVNIDVLTQAAAPELLGAVSVGSGHGFESQLRIHPSKLFQLDELGDLLKAIKKERGSGHMEGVISKIKMLMTSSHLPYTNSATADSKNFFTIDQPHLVIFGTATPEKFWSNLSVDSIEDGFMGRLFPLEVLGYAETQHPTVTELPASIIEQAKAWVAFNPGGNVGPSPLQYTHTPEAQQRHWDYCRAIDSKIPKNGGHKSTDCLWKRARGRAASLALLFAASRQGPSHFGTIELFDVNLAIKIANWITRRTIFKIATQVSENQFQRDCNRVFEILRQKPTDRSTLCNKTPWLRRKERNEILEFLIERGDVVVEEQKTKTNTKHVYKCNR